MDKYAKQKKYYDSLKDKDLIKRSVTVHKLDWKKVVDYVIKLRKARSGS